MTRMLILCSACILIGGVAVVTSRTGGDFLPGRRPPEPRSVQPGVESAPAEEGRAPTSARSRSLPQRLRHHFPNILLTTHQNKPVRFYDDLVKGRVVLINFMYTSCTGI